MPHTPTPAFPPALYAHPVCAAVLHEALALLGEGVAAERIEASTDELHWTASPLWIIDALGLGPIDAVLHAHAHDTHHTHGCCHHDHGHAGQEAIPPAPASTPLTQDARYVVEKMAHGLQRTGAAVQAGFYDYTAEPPQLWPGLKVFERHSRACDDATVRDRLQWSAWLAALTQAAPTLPTPIALATFWGADFPSSRALARAQIRALGVPHFLARAHTLVQLAGARFAISAAQIEHSEHG